MAISTTSITERTNNGGGTWKDYGGGGGSSANTDVFVTSTGSRARKVSNGIKGFAFEVNATGADLSADVVSIRWATFAGAGILDSRTNGGVAMVLEDTSGNISYWDVDGNDTYGGGWKVTVFDTSTTPSRNSGTAATLTAIRYVGVQWDETAGVGGGDPNCYIDQILTWPQAGITITGNTTSLIDDLVDVIDNPTNGPYGIFERRAGVVFSKAKLILSPDASNISETDRTLVFENPVYDGGTTIDSVSSELGLTSSDTDNITFTRCSIIAADGDETVTTDANRELDVSSATDFDLTTCIIRGFTGTNGVSLGGSGQAITGTTFQGCGQVTDSGAVIRDCVFRNSTTTAGAYLWKNATSDLQNCVFDTPSGGHGIEHDTIESVAVGTADAADVGTNLFDSGASFTTTVAVNEYVYNETDGSYGKVTLINSNTDLDHEQLQGGTENDWDFADAYSISPAQIYSSLTFTGAGTDVNNTATGSDGLFISKTGTSDPASATGNVVFIGSVSVTMEAVDKDDSPIQGVRVTAYTVSGDIEVMNTTTNASGIATASWTGATPTDIYYRYRKSSPGDTKYRNLSGFATIESSTGATVKRNMEVDPNNNA